MHPQVADSTYPPCYHKLPPTLGPPTNPRNGADIVQWAVGQVQRPPALHEVPIALAELAFALVFRV